MTRVGIALAVGFALLAAPAHAHKMPASYAKKQAVKELKSYWDDDGYVVLSRPSVSKCRRLSAHKIRCKGYVELMDRYGCGYATALVSVRFAFPTGTKTVEHVGRTRFFPGYDLANLGFDEVSCLPYGY